MTENTKDQKIAVRMAPSPTGNLHVGTARTTLFNYLFAKKFGGKFVLRIEDTDKERSTKEFEQDILDGLKWLGLGYDEFYRQSERGEIYASYIKKMLESGSAYISKEEAKEDGQRSEVIRFKNPNKKISFDDMIRGNIEFDTEELGDFVIAKSENEPLYHLAVVIDDHEMGITHVIRGEDHISNTPRQILIQEAIGAIRPAYMHLPLIFDSDRKKLSKRKHGQAVWVDTYKEEGYLPDALLNFLALLGWNPGTEKEIFTLEELIQAFDLKGIQKSAAIFDIKKLRWINREHIKKLPENTLKNIIEGKIKEKFPDATIPDGISDIISERIETLRDVDSMVNRGEVDYFFNEPDLEKSKIAWKEDSAKTASENLKKTVEMLSLHDDFKSIESIKQAIMPFAEERGRGSVLWPLRYSLSGQEKSPDPFTLLCLLGKEKSLERIRRAITELE